MAVPTLAAMAALTLLYSGSNQIDTSAYNKPASVIQRAFRRAGTVFRLSIENRRLTDRLENLQVNAFYRYVNSLRYRALTRNIGTAYRDTMADIAGVPGPSTIQRYTLNRQR